MIRRLVATNVNATTEVQVDPLRCLFLIASSGDAAVEREGMELIQQVSGNGVAAEVGVLYDKSEVIRQYSGSLPVHSQILADKNDLSVWRRLPAMLLQGRFDAVVTMGGEEETFWGRLGALRCELPVVMSYVRCTSGINWGSALQEMLASGTDRFLCESPEVAANVAAKSAIPSSRVETLSLGVDVEHHRPHPAERAAMRYDLGLSSANTACGFVARPNALDQLDFILGASRWTTGQSKDWQMVLLGVAQDEVEAIEKRVAERRLDRHVLVRPENGDTDIALSLLDVYVVNPDHINPRTEVLRAMASSLPVSVSHKSQSGDLVLDGISGWKHDAIEEAAAESWVSACTSEQRRRQFGRVGRELAASRWSISASARELSAMLHNLRDSKKDRFLANPSSESLPDESELLPV
jgi:glycosyltransferase involved in cell wall biosynthesis